LQNSPGSQVTPTHLLTTQAPSTQVLPVAQDTPAQASGLQVTSVATLPEAQLIPGANTTGWQAPSAGEQYSPSAQVTPLHGTSKQPLTQCPSTQVCP
jgi:hypothetical protein